MMKSLPCFRAQEDGDHYCNDHQPINPREHVEIWTNISGEDLSRRIRNAVSFLRVSFSIGVE